MMDDVPVDDGFIDESGVEVIGLRSRGLLGKTRARIMRGQRRKRMLGVRRKRRGEQGVAITGRPAGGRTDRG